MRCLPNVRKPAAAKASEITSGKSSRRFTETTPGTYEQSGNVFDVRSVYRPKNPPTAAPVRAALTGGFPTRSLHVPLEGQSAELSTEAQALPIDRSQLNDHS